MKKYFEISKQGTRHHHPGRRIQVSILFKEKCIKYSSRTTVQYTQYTQYSTCSTHSTVHAVQYIQYTQKSTYSESNMCVAVSKTFVYFKTELLGVQFLHHQVTPSKGEKQAKALNAG